MPRGFENIVGGQTRAGYFEHILFENEVLSPEVLDAVLESTAQRTVVEQTCNTSVDFEGVYDEEFTFEEVFNFFTLVFLNKIYNFFHFNYETRTPIN